MGADEMRRDREGKNMSCTSTTTTRDPNGTGGVVYLRAYESESPKINRQWCDAGVGKRSVRCR
jgi:hypothetical protein